MGQLTLILLILKLRVNQVHFDSHFESMISTLTSGVICDQVILGSGHLEYDHIKFELLSVQVVLIWDVF